MKTSTTLKKTFAIAALISLTTAPVYAHSGHDRSNIPLKWNFAQNVQNKIASQYQNTAVGLSKLDQKIFRDYGIRIGNIFKAYVNGQSLVIQRTSLGIQILDAKHYSNMAALPEIPIHKIHWASKIAMSTHPGHDHKTLPKAWTFSLKTADKIAVKATADQLPFSIGLSSHERNVMKAYDIRIGNTFQSRIAGHDLTVTLTSSGLTVQKTNNLEVATSNRTGAM